MASPTHALSSQEEPSALRHLKDLATSVGGWGDLALYAVGILAVLFSVAIRLKPALILGHYNFFESAYFWYCCLGPIAMLVMPTKQGKGIAFALVSFLMLVGIQWTAGFGLGPAGNAIERVYFGDLLLFGVAFVYRASEVNRTAFFPLVLFALIAGGLMGLSPRERSVRAPGESLAIAQKDSQYVHSLSYKNESFQLLDLRGADVRGAEFIGCDLTSTGIQFTGANLSRARFVDSTLNSSRLSGADLAGAAFEGKSCEGFNVAAIQPNTSNLKDLNFKCSLPPDLRDSAVLTPTANLDGLSLELLFPIRSYTIIANSVRRLKFTHNDVHAFSMMVVNADEASFIFSSLPGSQFSRTGREDHDGFLPISMKRSSFNGTDLRGAVFQNVDLEGSHFMGADLRGAQFNNCNLKGVDWLNAKLGKGTPEQTQFWRSQEAPF